MRVLRHVPTRVEAAEVLRPEQVALDRVAVQAFTAEERHDALAVGGRGRGRVAALGVAQELGLALPGQLVPRHLAGALVEADDAELVRALVRDRLHGAVEADDQLGVALLADRVGQEDPVAHHLGGVV